MKIQRIYSICGFCPRLQIVVLLLTRPLSLLPHLGRSLCPCRCRCLGIRADCPFQPRGLLGVRSGMGEMEENRGDGNIILSNTMPTPMLRWDTPKPTIMKWPSPNHPYVQPVSQMKLISPLLNSLLLSPTTHIYTTSIMAVATDQ